jgi:hypothetical protein
MSRAKVPDDVAAEILFLNRHTCCICNAPDKDVQIHHIDGDGTNNAAENLAVVCLGCHSKVTGNAGLGRHYSIEEVTRYKADWENRVNAARKAVSASAESIVRPFSKRILAEIEALQGEATELGSSLARALAIAVELGDCAATTFCRRELEGWKEQDKSVLRAAGHLPYHRQVVAYGSPLDARDSIRYFADPDRFWEYMEVNPDIFIEYKYFISLPVQEIENLVRGAGPKQIAVLTIRLGELSGKYDSPDSPFFLYSRTTAFRRVLTKICAELSALLMQMFEGSRRCSPSRRKLEQK